MEYKIYKTLSQSMLHTFLFEPNVYMCSVTSLEGDITAEEIENAVKKAYTQNETTMSKVILEEGNVYFQNIPQTGCTVFRDNRDWQIIRKECEKKAFRINEGELFRTYIIEEEKGYTLLMMVHHIASDGKGMLIVLEDILNNLAGREVEFKPLTIEGSELIPTDKEVAFPIMVFIRYLNYLWKKTGRMFGWEDYYEIHKRFWDAWESEVSFENVGKEELERIKGECKEKDITVNSYMMAKILKKHPEYHNVCFPISLRRENRSIINRVVLVKTNFKYNVKKTFWENAGKLHNIARQFIENKEKQYDMALRVRWMDTGLLDSCLMYTFCGYQNKVSKLLAELIGYSGKRKTHLTVTNLTNIEIGQDYGKFQVKKVTAIAPTMSAGKNVMCIGTFDGQMTIAHTKMIRR